MTSLSREIYRAQIGHEWAKRARWYAETTLSPSLSRGIATRNTLMDEPVANLTGRRSLANGYFARIFCAAR